MPSDQPARDAQNADMRIEIVKRELNQGALAGFDSSVTDYAAQLVVAALDSFDAAALDAAYQRGLAEGRTQATEGWEREHAVRMEWLQGPTVVDVEPRGRENAESCIAQLSPATRGIASVVSRLVGPWEPAEQTEATPERQPCPEGFHWIGQSFAHCDLCPFPAWEHAGMARPVQGAGPFDARMELKPWAPGEAEACKAKWGPRDEPAPVRRQHDPGALIEEPDLYETEERDRG